MVKTQAIAERERNRLDDDTRQAREALQRTLTTLALIIGSALPITIAFILIMVTNEDGENPLDRVPDYDPPLVETLTVPFDSAEPVQTRYRYTGRVRIVIEGTGQVAGMGTYDALYRFADPRGTPLHPPQPGAFGLLIDGKPTRAALGLTDETQSYADDHIYSGVYEMGRADHRLTLAFDDPDPAGNNGVFTVTVVQIQ